MESIITKVEQFFENQFKKFEESPVKTTLKALIIAYIVKKLYSWYKDSK